MKLTKQTLYKLILEQYEEEAKQGPQLDNERLVKVVDMLLSPDFNDSERASELMFGAMIADEEQPMYDVNKVPNVVMTIDDNELYKYIKFNAQKRATEQYGSKDPRRRQYGVGGFQIGTDPQNRTNFQFFDKDQKIVIADYSSKEIQP